MSAARARRADKPETDRAIARVRESSRGAIDATNKAMHQLAIACHALRGQTEDEPCQALEHIALALGELSQVHHAVSDSAEGIEEVAYSLMPSK